MHTKRCKTKEGYILVMTLIIVSLAITIGTYIFNRTSVFVPFTQIAIEGEQAKLLVHSTVQMMIAKLSQIPEEKKENTANGSENQSKNPKTALLKDQFTKILPTLNQWQTFELTNENDGIDAIVQICLSCEQGKINVNDIYDFTNKKFIGEKSRTIDWKIITEQLCKEIEKISKAKNLFPALEKLLQKRDGPFEDVSQLIESEPFADAFGKNIFYTPPIRNENSKNKPVLFLADIFTIWNDSKKINPFLFSNSILLLLGLADASKQNIQKRKEHIEKVSQNIKTTFNWKTDWKIFLEPLYKKEFSSVEKFASLLEEKYNPSTFCIRCEVTVGRITKKAIAIIKRKERANMGQIVYDSTINRFYWI